MSAEELAPWVRKAKWVLAAPAAAFHTPTRGGVERLAIGVLLANENGEICLLVADGTREGEPGHRHVAEATPAFEPLLNVLLQDNAAGAALQAEAAAQGKLLSLQLPLADVKVQGDQDATRPFLMPGLIDLHIHAPQYVYTGTGTDIPLMLWLTKHAFPAERGLKEDDERAHLVYRGVVDATLCRGTTTAVYFATLHARPTKILVETVLQRGQRGFVGKVNIDCRAPEEYLETTEDSLQATQEFVEWVLARRSAAEHVAGKLATPLVTPVLTPRFLPTCTEPLLRGLADIARRHDIPIQSHVAESADVVRFCHDVSADYRGETRDAEVFHSCGLFTEKTIMAHGVHLSDKELQIFVQTGATVAHCPLSNFYFANGAFRTRVALDAGVKVGLGTDVAGGYSPSMFDAMRAAVVAARALENGTDRWLFGEPEMRDDVRPTNGKVQAQVLDGKIHHLDYQDALYMATVGGAQALGLGDKLGSFGVGKLFDALVVDPCRGGAGGNIFVCEQMDSPFDVFQKVVNLADDRHIAKVFVQGRLVVENGVVLGVKASKMEA